MTEKIDEIPKTDEKLMKATKGTLVRATLDFNIAILAFEQAMGDPLLNIYRKLFK